jgi:hypothetical protein
VFWSLDIGIRDLPFDSFALEALDRLAQGGELVELFGICFIYIIFLKLSVSIQDQEAVQGW